MLATESHSRKYRTTLVHRHWAIPLESVLVLSAGVALAGSSPEVVKSMHIVWVLAAVSYLSIAIRRLILAATSPEKNRIELPSKGHHKGTWGASFQLDVIIILASSTMGIASSFNVSRFVDEDAFTGFSRLIAALTIVLAWLLLQVGFARLYADIWYQNKGGGGLDFPSTPDPGLIEFSYFAFGIGAAFQNSDVNITSSRMRMLVTAQSLLAFLFGTVLLAVAVSLIPGV